MIRRAALVAVLVLGLSGLARAQSPPLWDKLPPGPHPVGFKTSWQFDYSRRYNTTFDDKTTYAADKAPRPILINLWYPASKSGEAKRMPHRAYLGIRSHNPRLAGFSTKLAEYNRAVIAKEVMGKPEAELTGREQSLLDEFLDSPTACVRDAAPARGSFPLVVYHSGAGSSFEDDSVFCEFLASHGFVVLGSAFPKRNGSSLAPDGEEGSARDLAFLVAHARQIPGADWGRVGVVGHSLGAQAVLLYRSQADSLADAVVCLDTTQDYFSLKEPRWDYLTTPLVKNARNVACPVLMAAGPHAFFQLADSLQRARRYYLTIKDLDHNDYISQGITAKERLYQFHLADPKQTADARAEEKAALEKARAKYQAVCLYVLRFLEAELKADAAGKDFLAKQYRDTKLGGAEPHVEYVPEGRTGPEPYAEDGVLPPTPRQVRPFLRRHGSEKTIAVYKRFQKDAPPAPIYEHLFELNLVSDLLDEGKTRDSIALREYFRKTGLDCGKTLMAFGKSFQSQGRPELAAQYYKRLLLLEPMNGEAAARLKEVSAGKKEGP
jgi:pimeloyl-ACP methyl ester carboxylesterase